ncbi:hypothetical protein NHH03_24625, partial [Stieleria sp. TO1_6]|uniref:hypothetical protein n=1 Tax=Stieleria tagensis TaxID=2956795 RepID=UPI00209A9E9E
RRAIALTWELIPKHDNLLSPAAVEDYFSMYFWLQSDAWDKYRVLDALGSNPNSLQFNFREANSRYRFIRDPSENLLVPWGNEGTKLMKQMDSPYPLGRNFWRKAQRYCVQVRPFELQLLGSAGAIGKKQDRWVLTQPHLYDQNIGLCLSKADGVLPVDDLIA